jgi:guanine nucleotide-binding protein alpha-1 subunit
MSKFLRRHPTIDLEKDDPLTQAMAPPMNETPEEREARLLAQAEAQKRSDAIDEEINRQRNVDKKAPKCVRVLLLGKNLNCSGSPFIVTKICPNRPERIR